MLAQRYKSYIRETYAKVNDTSNPLTPHQYTLAFIRIFGHEPSQYEIDHFPNDFTLEQFEEKMTKKLSQRMDKLQIMREIFNQMDEKGMGYLELSQVRKVFKKILPGVPDHLVEEVFYEYDERKDGRVLFDSFCKMMESVSR